MTEFFLNIVNMSISASWIVLAVLLLRLLLKKAPKWIAVLLWGIVAIRLICPISVESALSLIPSSQTINPEVALNPPAIDSGVPIINNVINPIIGEATITLQPEKDLNIFQFIMPYLAGLWVVGITALLIYTSVSYVRVKKKICTAIMLRDNIFQSENIVSPFVLG
ncbi:MAG: M56 family metallopeptidase, partial [Firmicutes bacterium]|nr:M56 family metallopeptidase [Bacillota bacterium]